MLLSFTCKLDQVMLQKHFETTIEAEANTRIYTLGEADGLPQCGSAVPGIEQVCKKGRMGLRQIQDRDEPLLLWVPCDFVTKTCCREYLPTP